MKKIFILLLALCIVSGSIYAQDSDNYKKNIGLGIDVGTLTGSGFSFRKVMNSGYGIKVVLTPPLFSNGKIFFYNLGLGFSKQLYSMRDCRFFLTLGTALAYVDNKMVFSAPSLSIEGEYLVTYRQSFTIGVGWTLYSVFMENRETLYQSFPGFQFGYTYYFK